MSHNLHRIISSLEEGNECLLFFLDRDSEIASDIEPAKPQVKQQLEDQTVLEGNKVRMDCVIVGQPEPEVRFSLSNEHFAPFQNSSIEGIVLK